MVSGQLEDSLRHEIESYIEGRLSGVKQEIAALQSQLNEALSQLLDRQSEVQLDGGVAASIMEHLRAAHEEGIDLAASESARAKASSDMAIVKAAISEINQQPSQAEILTILVNRASTFAPRVAFFVIKGEQCIGWRARGFEGTVGDSAVQQISFPLDADTAIGHASRSRESWSGGPGSHAEDHIILNRLGDDPPARIVALPLVVRARSVAVLYADSAELDADAINLEALETLVSVAGMAVELLAARSAPAKQAAGQADEATPAPLRETEPPAYAPVAEYDELTPVVEESAPAPEVSASEYDFAASPAQTIEPEAAEVYEAASEPPVETPFVAPAEVHREAPIEPPVAAVPVEAPEPFAQQSVPAATEPSPAVTAPTRRRYGAAVELPIAVANDEERRIHTDAQRFARLLVSEVKLYNEQKVVEGRNERDLYKRLREHIDRSRQMYDQRVQPEVAQRYDYFHHELVNTLAEGDADKLGSDYPGATVSV